MKKKVVSSLLAVCAAAMLSAGCADKTPVPTDDTQAQDTQTDVSADTEDTQGTEDTGTGQENQENDSADEDSSEPSSEGIIALKENEGVVVGDSDKLLTVYTESVDEYDGCAVYLSYGDDTLLVTEYCTGLDSAYVLAEYTNSFYVLIGELYDNDYCELELVKIDSTGIELCDGIGASYANGAPDSMDSFELVSEVDVLGSYRGQKTYRILDDAFYTADEFYTIENGPKAENPVKLVTAAELTVELDGKKATLPVGTGIYIVGTDMAGTARFVTEDEQEGTLHYTPASEEDWEIKIDGVSEYEVFESLPYAG